EALPRHSRRLARSQHTVVVEEIVGDAYDLPRRTAACNHPSMESRTGDARVVADLMLRDPKTLPVDAPVSEVRAILENPSVQMVLLTDGATFAGAVTDVPADASPEMRALDF